MSILGSGARTVKNADNKEWLISQPYLAAMLEGLIPGHNILTIDGFSPAINTGDQLLWGVAPATQTAYVYPSAATTVTMVSSDATDNQAGVGARSVLITGLLAGYVEDTETLAMHPTDGTIAVTSAKSWLRILRAEVITAGSAGENAGDITILDGTDILMFMEADTNKSLQGTYTVPAGKTAYIMSIKGTGAGTKNVDFHIHQRLFGGLFTQEKHRTVNNSAFEMTLMTFPEKTDIEIRVHSDTNGGVGDITLQGWTEDN
jgi:hypothetical protein